MVRRVEAVEVVPEGVVLGVIKPWLLALLVAVAVAIAMPERAKAATEGWADSDGHVPIYSASYPGVELGY